jgi:hypothetical protein
VEEENDGEDQYVHPSELYKIGKTRAKYWNFNVLLCKRNGHFPQFSRPFYLNFLKTKIVFLFHTFLGPFEL